MGGLPFIGFGTYTSIWHMLTHVLQPLQISAFRMTGLFGVDTLGRMYTLSFLSSAPLRTSPAPSSVTAAPTAAPAFKKIPAFYCRAFFSFFHFRSSANTQSPGAIERNVFQNSTRPRLEI